MRQTYVLPVCPLLVSDFEVPCKRGLKERLLLRVVQVNALVSVAFPVGRDLDDRLDFRPACNKCAGDDRVVRCAKHTNRAEQILARGLETVEKATDLVRRHVRLCEFRIVLEVHTPK